MRNIHLLLFAMLVSVSVMAQPPQKFNYQGVARMNNGNVIASKNISLRISILDGSATGTTVYAETHNVTTNQFGLYSLAIGGGTVVSGSMGAINWKVGDKYVKVEIDPAGGASYTDLGSAQLLSVPYAIYAGEAGGNTLNGTTNTLLKFTSATAAGNSGVTETTAGVGIGIPTALSKLHVVGSSNTTLTIGGLTFEHNGIVGQTSTTSTSNGSRGVLGAASNSSVENQGLFGLAHGTNSSAGNVGVLGYGTPTVSSSSTSVGIYGIAGNGATNIGIYGNTSGTTSADLAGYFNGTVNINGTLAKSAGTFKIDHPLDPENKYLYHSFVESPDMMNVYNGNVTTSANGVAVVELPTYFEALNKDFRYQLTVIGTFAQAIVSKKVQGNKFEIKTSEPNVEVSWQVTGIRQDKYAEAHRVVPEVEKEEKFKGYYLNAKEYGKPNTQSINYLLAPASARKVKGAE